MLVVVASSVRHGSTTSLGRLNDMFFHGEYSSTCPSPVLDCCCWPYCLLAFGHFGSGIRARGSQGSALVPMAKLAIYQGRSGRSDDRDRISDNVGQFRSLGGRGTFSARARNSIARCSIALGYVGGSVFLCSQPTGTGAGRMNERERERVPRRLFCLK